MFTVYGLRLHGDIEVRYVGRTSKQLDVRLAGHLASRGWNYLPISVWMTKHRREVEIFEISTAETKPEACRKEREAVEFCLKLNHRLFNRWLVPAHSRGPRSDARTITPATLEKIEPWTPRSATPDPAESAPEAPRAAA